MPAKICKRRQNLRCIGNVIISGKYARGLAHCDPPPPPRLVKQTHSRFFKASLTVTENNFPHLSISHHSAVGKEGGAMLFDSHAGGKSFSLCLFVCLGCGLEFAPLLIPPKYLSTYRKT
jgi:hypothetical protein